jgi:hypothetical protein
MVWISNILWMMGEDIRIINPAVTNKSNKFDFKMNAGKGKYYPGDQHVIAMAKK